MGGGGSWGELGEVQMWSWLVDVTQGTDEMKRNERMEPNCDGRDAEITFVRKVFIILGHGMTARRSGSEQFRLIQGFR